MNITNNLMDVTMENYIMDMSQYQLTTSTSKNVFEDSMTWINEFSENTQKAYGRHISYFFDWYKNKRMNELTPEDLQIQNSVMLNYKKFIMSLPENYSNNTINNMLAAVQSFYVYLERNHYNVKSAWVTVKPLPENAIHAGGLTLPEAEEMSQRVLDTAKGFEKSILIQMAYVTSFRKTSLLNLTLSDFKPHFRDSNIYEVSTIGKGNKLHTVLISKELYDKVVEVANLPYRKEKKDGKIFGLDKSTIQNMMDFLKIEMNFSPARNIVFHSFRGVLASFGTLEEARQHFNHSSSAVTEKSYRHLRDGISTSLSLRATTKLDKDIFSQLSKEELIEIIMSQQEGQIITMQHQAQNLVNKKPK